MSVPLPVKWFLRFSLIQCAVWFVAFSASMTFGKQLLLLDDAVAEASAGGALRLLFVGCVLALLTNAIAIVRVRKAQSDPKHMARFQRMPIRLAATHLAYAWAASACSLLSVFRPPTNDDFTQLAEVILAWTACGAGSLASYLVFRNVVLVAAEKAPQAVLDAALAIRTESGAFLGNVRTRIVLAATVAVGFVSASTSLLVTAEVRAQERSSRQKIAENLAAAVLPPLGIDADTAGIAEAKNCAGSLGFTSVAPRLASAAASANPPGSSVEFDRTSLGETHMTFRSDAFATDIAFATALPNPSYAIYFVLTLMALVTALFSGAWVGSFYVQDLGLATSEIRAMVVVEPETHRKRRVPRFAAVP
jgi:hypothetical protein